MLPPVPSNSVVCDEEETLPPCVPTQESQILTKKVRGPSMHNQLQLGQVGGGPPLLQHTTTVMHSWQNPVPIVIQGEKKFMSLTTLQNQFKKN